MSQTPLTDEALRELIQQLKNDQEALQQQLTADREAYLAAFKGLNDTLVRALSANQGPLPLPITSNVPPSAPSVITIPQSILGSPVLSPFQSSRRMTGTGSINDNEKVQPRSIISGITDATGDDSSESGDDESFFVQQTLPVESFTEEGLRLHLKNHTWDDHGDRVVGSVIKNQIFITKPNLFKDEKNSGKDIASYTHGSIYDVGTDGSALAFRPDGDDLSVAIWQGLSKTNTDASKRQAVGRIMIIREPSPILFGALHYTMKPHFDMDGIFKLLSDGSKTKAYMRGCYKKDPRKQRTFIFVLKYHTIVGEERKPMDWQASDKDLQSTKTHIPISSCSSVVALSLGGTPIKSVRSKSRRKPDVKIGHVYDPFAPWRVLNIQCYPDWKSTVDDHDTNRHYVNGPDAFLVTLLTEYRDAQKRFLEINKRIVTLATPPSDFMFNRDVRDVLLFEDENYTYSRRYFWAFQTLATMNDQIEEMINAYRETFTDDVWSGKDKLLWPGQRDQSSRFNNWRRKMASIRADFENEIKALERVLDLNLREQKDIKSLRDQLFSGTSVLESRKSVEQTSITVQQGQNIKLLTLVSIFFLPLTFVTSIFGMTNMPPNDNFVPFGIVTVIICVPTYLMIGSLNTHRGMRWWKNRIEDIYHHFLRICAFIFMKLIRNEERAAELRAKSPRVESRYVVPGINTGPPRSPPPPDPVLHSRTSTTLQHMNARGVQLGNYPREQSIQSLPPHLNSHHRTSSIKFDEASLAAHGSPRRVMTELTSFAVDDSTPSPSTSDPGPLSRTSDTTTVQDSTDFRKKSLLARTFSNRMRRSTKRPSLV